MWERGEVNDETTPIPKTDLRTVLEDRKEHGSECTAEKIAGLVIEGFGFLPNGNGANIDLGDASGSSRLHAED